MSIALNSHNNSLSALISILADHGRLDHQFELVCTDDDKRCTKKINKIMVAQVVDSARLHKEFSSTDRSVSIMGELLGYIRVFLNSDTGETEFAISVIVYAHG